MISRLRRALANAFGGRGATGHNSAQGAHGGGSELDRRIEEARRRLKATIPPPED